MRHQLTQVEEVYHCHIEHYTLTHVPVDSLRVLEGSPREGGACVVAGANGVNGELADEDTSPPVGAPVWSLPPVEQWRQVC